MATLFRKIKEHFATVFDKLATSTFTGRVLARFSKNGDADQAAALSYYLLFSFVPMILALVSLLGIVGWSSYLIDHLLPLIRENLPEQLIPIITEPLLNFSRFGGANITFVIGILTMAWSASKYLAAFGRAMDKIQDTENPKPVVAIRVRMVVLTLLLLFFLVAGTGLFLLGDTVTAQIVTFAPRAKGVIELLILVRLPIIFVILIATLALLYFTTPGDFALRGRQKGRAFFPGAFAAIVLTSFITAGFTAFVTNFGTYDKIYGTIAGIMLLTFWFWLVNCAFLMGAEINQQIDVNRGLTKDDPDKR